ncbi:MAG TPA: histone deacetylase family protein [Gaiellaceae bacterium]|nr:histone deacetylase family protein [Gaiellaceae bacterium]
MLPFVWSDDCLRHEPEAEVWVGVRTPATELPARALAIREALVATGAQEVPAAAHDDSALLAVHDPALVGFLRTAWEEWSAADLPSDRVVPYVFARSELTGGRTPPTPAAVWARPGRFAYDTMTLIGPGTWEAARAAVDVALTAVDLVAGGEPIAYACGRPPGHHVTRSLYGGSCYLNNSAVAATELLARHGGGPVAVVDIDAHHGNGTQELFLGRDDVLTASVHVDPGAGWFPHFLGFAAENDAANLNLPLAPGTGDDGWLVAVREAAGFAASARALVVALGVDAAAGDPESPLEVSAAGYREAGRILGALELPTVVVQEGGYDLATIGALVVETLTGLAR